MAVMQQAKALGRALHSMRRGLALVFLGAAVTGARANVPEHELKAQVVVRTLMFAQWPANVLPPNETLVVCAADDHPMTPAIARQDGQLINGHRLQLRRTTGDPGHQCHVALVGPGGKAAVAVQRRRGLLLVGDLLGGLAEGVMLNVQIELGRVVFDVNLKAAREDGLDFDARLLRLARFVQRD
jgi:hypothetical protein